MNQLEFSRWLSGKKKKNPPASVENAHDGYPDWEDRLEEEMAACSSILAWRMPWTEEPSVLQTRGSQGVGHDWVAEHACMWATWQQHVMLNINYINLYIKYI